MTVLQQSERLPPIAWLAVNAALWLSVIACFAAAFEAREAMVALIGPRATDAAPLILAGVTAAGAGWWAWWRRARLRPWSCALAAAVFLAGLLTTDPQFPAKRLHVPEYALLALLVWLSLDGALDRTFRSFAAFSVAFLLGALEEMVQGLLPTRTYGLADIATNASGAAAGALFAASFRTPESSPRSSGWTGKGEAHAAGFAACLVVLTGAVLLLLALYRYRDLAAGIPFWSLLPLAAAFCITLLPVAGGAGAVQVVMSLRLISASILVFAVWIHASGVDIR